MKFIKIKVYDPDMKNTHDLFLNLHTVISFEEIWNDGVHCILITTVGNEPYNMAHLDEFEHLKNNVISPFCGDV